MINQLHQIPLAGWLGITSVVVLLLSLALLVRSSGPARRSRGGYQPQGPDRSFDECFPEQPMTVRRGVVAERNEVMLPQYSLCSIRLVRPVMVPHYAFTIICNDVIGNETLQITVEKNKVNVFADAGREVELKSQLSRLDYTHMVHTITAI